MNIYSLSTVWSGKSITVSINVVNQSECNDDIKGSDRSDLTTADNVSMFYSKSTVHSHALHMMIGIIANSSRSTFKLDDVLSAKDGTDSFERTSTIVTLVFKALALTKIAKAL